MTEPTPLEKAVLLAFSEQLAPEDCESFTLQAAALTVRRRENTGAGFYTHFDVGADSVIRPLPDLRALSVEAEVEGLSDGLGFILWVTQGRIDHLEGYTFGDSTEDLDLTTLKFKVIDLKRKYLF
jgi:hypothetical protein